MKQTLRYHIIPDITRIPAWRIDNLYTVDRPHRPCGVDCAEVYIKVRTQDYPTAPQGYVLAKSDVCAFQRKGLIRILNHGTPQRYLNTVFYAIWMKDDIHQYITSKYILTLLGIEDMSNISVATFEGLLQLRSLTGILRIFDHGLLNGRSVHTSETNYVIIPQSLREFDIISDILKLEGFLIESTFNDANSTALSLNAFKVIEGICEEFVSIQCNDKDLDISHYCMDTYKAPPVALQKHLKGIELSGKETIDISALVGFDKDGNGEIDDRVVVAPSYPVDDSFYPFIDESIDELVANFNTSKDNLLFLIGPPGTGKTTLLREIAFKMNSIGRQVIHIFGEKTLRHEGFDKYISTIPANSLVLIEDADSLLAKRADGNEAMSTLLNEIDGISSKNNKYIVSTNLPTVKSVDEAILRVGRCFKVIEFRTLTTSEMDLINIANPNITIPATDRNLPLSEILNNRVNESITKSVGFINRN